MGTGGALMYTFTVSGGSTVYIQTDNASAITTLFCLSTSAYCTSYTECTSATVINANTDIYIGSSATTC
jgi:hypothetical protein